MAIELGHVASAVAAAHLRRHGRTLLLLALLVGIAAGVAITGFTGARRTGTALDRLIDRTEFPDAVVQLADRMPGDVEGLTTSSAGEVVTNALTVGIVEGAVLTLIPVQSGPELITFHQVVDGREADPSAAHEITVSERFTEFMGIDVGDTISHTALTDDEFAALLADEWEFVATGLSMELEVVGVTRTPLDVTTDGFPTIIGTPAYHELLDPSPASPAVAWVDLGPDQDVDAVLADAGLDRESAGAVLDFVAERDELDDTVGVLVTGMLVLAAVAVAATIALLSQLAARSADQLGSVLPVLGSMGLGRRDLQLVAAAVAAIPAGFAALTAMVVAVAGSRWTPVGLARQTEPSPGTDLHVVGLSVGAASIGIVVVGASVFAARGWLSVAGPRSRARERAVAVPAGPVATVALALATRGLGRNLGRTVSVAGLAAGVALLLASTSFASTLGRLVDDPVSWGRVADHEVNLPGTVQEPTLAALDASDDVAAHLPFVGGTVSVEDLRLEAYWLKPGKGSLSPTVVAGRLPIDEGEVTLGPGALRTLGVEVGETVKVDGDERTVVGSALTFNRADGGTFTEGAVLGGPPTRSGDFTAVLVRFAPGVDHEEAANVLYGDLEYGTPASPRAITNLHELRPLVAPVTAVAVVVALAALFHVGLSTGAAARREFAVLAALGMRRRELWRALVLATGVLVGAGAIAAVPVAAVLARATWRAAIGSTGLVSPMAVPLAAAALPVGLLVAVLLVSRIAGARELSRRPARELAVE